MVRVHSVKWVSGFALLGMLVGTMMALAPQNAQAAEGGGGWQCLSPSSCGAGTSSACRVECWPTFCMCGEW